MELEISSDVIPPFAGDRFTVLLNIDEWGDAGVVAPYSAGADSAPDAFGAGGSPRVEYGRKAVDRAVGERNRFRFISKRLEREDGAEYLVLNDF